MKKYATLSKLNLFLLTIIFCGLGIYAQTEPLNLEVGKIIERELKGGEAHQYRIAMPAAQFLHLEVNQKGIDVAVILSNSSGQKLLEVDSPNGNQGKEIVFYLNDTAGDYRLEIVSPEKNAPNGKYEIQIIELRAAVEKDKNHIAAENLYREAEAFVNQDTAAGFQNAFTKYQESLAQWRIYGDKKEIAATLNALGQITDGDEAFGYFMEATRLYEEIGDKKHSSRTRHNIGLLYKVSYPRKALEYFKPALEQFRAIGDKFAEPVALNNIGECHLYLSEYQPALDAFEQAS